MKDNTAPCSCVYKMHERLISDKVLYQNETVGTVCFNFYFLVVAEQVGNNTGPRIFDMYTTCTMYYIHVPFIFILL